jgi:nitrate reductase beta subunit
LSSTGLLIHSQLQMLSLGVTACAQMVVLLETWQQQLAGEEWLEGKSKKKASKPSQCNTDLAQIKYAYLRREKSRVVCERALNPQSSASCPLALYD